MRGLTITYFVAVGCLFLLAAFVSMQGKQPMQPRLVAPPAIEGIGVTDVMLAGRSTTVAKVELPLLIFLGPVGGIFRGPTLLAAIGVLLLATAILLHRRLRLGTLVGVVWTLGIVILLVVAMGRISVSYSLAARLVMFGPALALNVALFLGLGLSGRSAFSFSVNG